MANHNCQACDDLKSTAPSLIVNGMGDAECASLQNDTGLNPSSGNNDCTDLNNLNDCLVGNMEQEVDAYDVCEWKPFIKRFIPNLWTTLKGIICAICGIWTNIHNLWNTVNGFMDAINRLQCQINYAFRGATFSLGESYADDTKSHIVAGKGVSFLNVSTSGTSADISLVYIAGGLATLTGSCKFYDSNFTDGAACYSFDNNGTSPAKSSSRRGNSAWTGTDTKPGNASSELVYEIRIKKSEFPQIAALYNGLALNTGGGGYHANVIIRTEGAYASGQHGDCNTLNGNPISTGYDRGHLVPAGWIYLQVRVTWIESMQASASGAQYSPQALLGVRMNQNEIPC